MYIKGISQACTMLFALYSQVNNVIIVSYIMNIIIFNSKSFVAFVA